MRAKLNVRVLASCTVSGISLTGLVVLLAYSAMAYTGFWQVVASLSLLALITAIGLVVIPLLREQYRGYQAKRLLATIPYQESDID